MRRNADHLRADGDTHARAARSGINSLAPSDSCRGIGVLRLRRRIRIRESACSAQDDNLVVGSEGVSVTLFIFRPTLTVLGSPIVFQNITGSALSSPSTFTALCLILRDASPMESASLILASNLSSLIRVSPLRIS